jgi:hypothetical protein
MPVDTDHILRISVANGAGALMLGMLLGIPVALWPHQIDSARGADADHKYVCLTERIPTSWGFGNPSVAIEKHDVEFAANGRSAPDVHFRNVGDSRLEALAAVVRYTDQQGRTIDDVPVAAGTSQVVDALRLPFAVEGVQYWKRPVAPGEDMVVAGVYDGIRTGVCPAHATVTFLRLQFAGSHPLDFSSPGWHVRPLPRSVPEVPESLAKLNLNPPDFIAAQLKIDASGRVIDLTPGDEENSEVVSWLRNFMQQSWRFYPALRDGRPVEEQVRVLFGFARDRVSMLAQAPSLQSPVLVIQIMRTLDFFPNVRNQQEFRATFGGIAEGDVVGKGEVIVVSGDPQKQ